MTRPTQTHLPGFVDYTADERRKHIEIIQNLESQAKEQAENIRHLRENNFWLHRRHQRDRLTIWTLLYLKRADDLLTAYALAALLCDLWDHAALMEQRGREMGLCAS